MECYTLRCCHSGNEEEDERDDKKKYSRMGVIMDAFAIACGYAKNEKNEAATGFGWQWKLKISVNFNYSLNQH